MRYAQLRKRCIALLMLALLFSSAQAEAFLAVVTSETAQVYAEASGSTVLGTLKRWALVTVQAQEADMAQVSKGGRTGWMRLSDLDDVRRAGAAARVTRETKVYRSPSTKSASVRVREGLALDLLATRGDWAMVQRNGVVGYMNKKYVEKTAQEAVEAPVTTERWAAVVSAQQVTVYRSPSTDSLSLGTLKKGAGLTVCAQNGTWAYVEKNGRYGYCPLMALSRSESTPAPTATPKPAATQSASSYLNDTSLSVEKRIYLFATREMGLNTAAACGLLANVERECDFNVNDLSYDGGYGIVQWTGPRNTDLKNWCKKNGYDYTRLEGQCWFLKYELETSQKKTLNYMKGVSNTAAGAYDAAYYFCYWFEIPANRQANAVRRGNLAKDTYWRRYAI